MRRLSLVFHLVLIIFSVLGVFVGCTNSPVNSVNGQAEYTYSVSVLEDGVPVPNAEIIGIVSESEEIYSQCNENGFVEIASQKPLSLIFAVVFGASGYVETKEIGLVKINLNKLDVPDEEGLNKKRVGTETFWPVFMTNSSGDVYFKYGIFAVKHHFWLYGTIPSWVCEPNPNNWGGWHLKDYYPYDNGWKLLVPRRARAWYLTAYRRSISKDLYLVTIW